MRAKNDVTHATELKLEERIKKSIFEVIVTSYGRNKNLDEKKQEKANNSLGYRLAPI